MRGAQVVVLTHASIARIPESNSLACLMDMRPARSEDVDRVIDVLDEASGWLRFRGIVQWPIPFPREVVAQRIQEHRCYLAWDGAEVVGTLSLQPADPEQWGERPADALYLRGLAVRRSHVGKGRCLPGRNGRRPARGKPTCG